MVPRYILQFKFIKLRPLTRMDPVLCFFIASATVYLLRRGEAKRHSGVVSLSGSLIFPFAFPNHGNLDTKFSVNPNLCTELTCCSTSLMFVSSGLPTLVPCRFSDILYMYIMHIFMTAVSGKHVTRCC